MSNGFSVKLPLQYDITDGPYRLNKTYEDVIKQNIKMLLLTSAGERCMDPFFGVGLRRLLFGQDEKITKGDIISRINKQISHYMPFISVQEIDSPIIGDHQVRLTLRYKIIPLDISQTLSIDLVSTANN